MRALFYKLALAVIFAAAIANVFLRWKQTKAERGFTYIRPLIQTTTEPQESPTIQLEDENLKAVVTKEVSKASEPKNLAPKPTSIPLPPSAFRIPILMYHYVGDNPNPGDTTRNSLTVPLKNFEEQMRYLSQNGFTTLSLDSLTDIAAKKITAPAKPVVLTFDDGYIDFYVNAFPLLKKYNLRAVVFLPTGLMNQSYYMSWDQIKEIGSSGLISFESHSVTHRYLVSLSRGEIFKELKYSKEKLESETGQKVNWIAYPFGDSNDLIYEIAKSVGYIGGIGTWDGTATNVTMNMPRLRMGSYVTLDFFASLPH